MIGKRLSYNWEGRCPWMSSISSSLTRLSNCLFCYYLSAVFCTTLFKYSRPAEKLWFGDLRDKLRPYLSQNNKRGAVPPWGQSGNDTKNYRFTQKETRNHWKQTKHSFTLHSSCKDLHLLLLKELKDVHLPQPQTPPMHPFYNLHNPWPTQRDRRMYG